MRFLSKSLVLGVAVLGASLAPAQTAPTPASSTTSASRPTPPTDEVITLSAFNVSAEPSGAYIASESVTGSRVAEKIKNLPYSVNVVTAEFLNDFAFFDLNEDFAYTSAFGNMDAGGGYTIRGFGATKALRNGFPRFGLVDRVNVDRIEIIKGPSAAVYGETRPGGLVNIITKKPKTRPGYMLSGSFGSFDTVRAELEATGPLTASKRTAYLFNAAYYERGYPDDPFARLRQRTVSGALSHKFSDRTSILVELEYLARDADSNPQIPAINDASLPATQRRGRLATEIASFNYVGPANNFTNREITSVNATLEHKLNEVFSLRAGANYFNRNYWTFGQGGDAWDISGANAGTFGNRSPSVGAIYEDGGGFQADALAHYFLFDRKLENRTLLTLDYSSYWRVDPQWRLPASGTGSLANLVSRGLYAQRLNPGNPNYAVPAFTLENYPTINRWNDNRADIIGTFLRHQTAAFNGRLIVAGGIRYDTVKLRLQDKRAANQAGNPALNVTENTELTATTPNIGVNVGVTQNVRAYANYAKSFFPDTQNTRANDPERANEGGYGLDYGFKVGLFEDRLSFTLGGFFIERTNVGVDDIDEETGLTVRRRIGNTRSRGVELDANWNVTPNFTTTFGYGYVDSVVTEAGRDLDLVGRQVARTPQHNGYLTARYQWRTGRLNGLTVNFGVTYTGETTPFDAGGIAEPATIGGQPNANRGLILTNDARRDIRIPGYFATRAGVRYTWRPQESKFNHTFAVNLANLLNEDYVTSNRRLVEPFNASFTYTLRW
jgi:outer membrane receptor protein involved in Fe transport